MITVFPDRAPLDPIPAIVLPMMNIAELGATAQMRDPNIKVMRAVL